MNKTLSLTVNLLLLLILFSCERESFLKPDYKDYESGIVVFMDPSIAKTLKFEEDSQDSISDLRGKKEKIKDFVDRNYGKLDVNLDSIHVDRDIWFTTPRVKNQQIEKLEKDTVNVLDIYPNYLLELQGRKPMMQGTSIIQGRKPMMQEDWRYDAVNFASQLVLWIGGGVEITLPPSLPDRTVWIMDTGIATDHQDLIGVDTSRGFSVFGGDTYKTDENGHGTLIAGSIGAKAFNQHGGNPNDIGINGVVPGAKMVSVKVLDRDGNSNLSNLIDGIEYLERNALPGDIINISLGRQNKSPNCNWGQLGNKLKSLASNGVFIVFSAGNETSLNSSNFPSCLADGVNMISIGSIDMYCNGQTKVFSSFSNFGTIISGGIESTIWVAPGEQIFSTYPPALVGDGTNKGTYGLVAGTSFSAAIMSGIIYGKGGLPEGIDSVARGGDSPKYPIAKLIERP
jgi:hypothetical protein